MTTHGNNAPSFVILNGWKDLAEQDHVPRFTAYFDLSARSIEARSRGAGGGQPLAGESEGCPLSKPFYFLSYSSSLRSSERNGLRPQLYPRHPLRSHPRQLNHRPWLTIAFREHRHARRALVLRKLRRQPLDCTLRAIAIAVHQAQGELERRQRRAQVHVAHHLGAAVSRRRRFDLPPFSRNTLRLYDR